ncbi:MAG TPA: ATP-binding protein [Gaiellaceae bacterium]|nr:ATP-binding protein [Gaiellaceae bacterium]
MVAAPATTPAADRRLLRLGAVVSLGAVGALATAAGAGLDGLSDPDAWSLVRGVVVALYIGVGTYTWWRRPASRFGVMLIHVGLLFSIAALTASHEPLPHTLGRVALAVLVVYLSYAFLTFPRDRLGSRLERRLIGGFGVATAFLWALALPFVETLPVGGPLVDCGGGCPDNALRFVPPSEPITSAMNLAINGVTAAALVGVIAVLVDRARSPARLRRRLVLPLLAAVVALAASYAAFTVVRELGVDDAGALRVFGALAGLSVPVALLVGQVRGRVFTATTLVELVGRIGREPATPARVEKLLREALGDPLLRLALRAPGDGYVDVDGKPMKLPPRRREVGVTPVVRNGRPVAALLHDATLDEGSGIAEGLAATALLLLENAQLVTDLRASRARIVDSAQRERLRLERNLHDGAQQRLFTMRLKLAEARGHVRDAQVAHDLDELAAEAAAAAEELRALAHGIYPTVLRERGLHEALRSAARTASIPVRVVADGLDRCSSTVEEAVYFCVLEAVQNAAKHAGPDARVVISLERLESELRFSVSDDGRGFDPDRDAEGIGLVSMRDRIGAVGGALDVVTRPGAGTEIHGVVPAGRPPDAAAPKAARDGLRDIVRSG